MEAVTVSSWSSSSLPLFLSRSGVQPPQTRHRGDGRRETGLAPSEKELAEVHCDHILHSRNSRKNRVRKSPGPHQIPAPPLAIDGPIPAAQRTVVMDHGSAVLCPSLDLSISLQLLFYSITP